jgi:hypothetical protein
VLTTFGLGEIVGSLLATGRITKWVLELMGLNIAYIPQMAIKFQALANFMAEWTETQQPPQSLKSTRAGIFMALSPSMVLGEAYY